MTSKNYATEGSFIHNSSDGYSTLWSGRVLWKDNISIDVHILPHSKTSHLRDWSKNRETLLQSQRNIDASNDDFVVQLQTLHFKFLWSSSSGPLPEDVKNSFFGFPMYRQLVNIVIPVNSSSKRLIDFVEHPYSVVFGLALVPTRKNPYASCSRPLYVDLKNYKIEKSAGFYYVYGWILNEDYKEPFLQYLATKTLNEREFSSFSAAVCPSNPSNLLPHPTFDYQNPKRQTMPLTTELTFRGCGDLYRRREFLPRQTFKHQNHSSTSKLIRPIAVHPKDSQKLIIKSDDELSIKEKEDRYNREIFAARLKSEINRSSLANFQSANKQCSKKEFWSSFDSSGTFFSGSEGFNTEEQYLMELIHNIVVNERREEDAITFYDKILALISLPIENERMLYELTGDLLKFLNLKASKDVILNRRVEIKIIAALKNSRDNFKRHLMVHLKNERENLITNQKQKQARHIASSNNNGIKQILKKKTTGVFSGHFYEKNIVHFNTVILQHLSDSGADESAFSQYYCLFIPLHSNFFSWEKWKDDKVVMENNAKKKADCHLKFRMEPSYAEWFDLRVQYVDSVEEFQNYISDINIESRVGSKTNHSIPCLLAFPIFYFFFQKVEKFYKVEPIITWKPIIFSSSSEDSQSNQHSALLQRKKEEDPFYSLLMTVFGNRVYGLSYRKRIALSFILDKERRDYQALVFNNNVIFVPDEVAAEFLRELDNLIFGCETFETFLIKTDKVTNHLNNVLKVKIPICESNFSSNAVLARQRHPSMAIPNILIKAKILNESQIEDNEFLKRELYERESFIVERKHSLQAFQKTLSGQIQINTGHKNLSVNTDFRMVRKIHAVAKLRIQIRNYHADVILFYFIPLGKAESSEIVFIDNSENENVGRTIDVLVAPLGENIIKLVSKSNLMSPVVLVRKDKTTWGMKTDIKEHIRCLGRVIMTSSHKNRILEAVKSKDIFFSDLESVRNAFASTNKTCYIRSWSKLHGLDENLGFSAYHEGEEFLEPWDTSLDNTNECQIGFMGQTPLPKNKPAVNKNDSKCGTKRKGELLTDDTNKSGASTAKPDENFTDTKNSSHSANIVTPPKKRKKLVEQFNDCKLSPTSFPPCSIPLKKRMVVTDSSESATSPTAFSKEEVKSARRTDENVPPALEEEKERSSPEVDLSPMVIIRAKDKQKADNFLKFSKKIKIDIISGVIQNLVDSIVDQEKTKKKRK